MRAFVLLAALLYVTFAYSQGISSVTLPLYGGILEDGGFFAPLALGTPQQPFRLQIDTGSADLLVFSQGCIGCTPGTTRFNYGASQTAARVMCNSPIYDCAQSGCQNGYCDFDDQYGDGSHVAGQVITDVFNLGGGLHANISFGMILNSSKDFEPAPFDGIWGLAWYTISDWNGTSAFQNVVNQLGLENRFSMCLTPQTPSMVLGGPNDDSSYTWTNVIKKLYYVVQFNDFQVNGQSLGLPSSAYNGDPGAIVDSGTTLFILPNAAYNALYNVFNALCKTVSLKGVCGVSKSQSIFAGGGASKCVQMSQSDIDAFPKVSVLLEGAEPLSIDGNTYLIEINNGCYSMGIGGGLPSGTIMGDVFMQAFNVIFDRANMRVGFADLSTCSTPSSVSAVATTTANGPAASSGGRTTKSSGPSGTTGSSNAAASSGSSKSSSSKGSSSGSSSGASSGSSSGSSSASSGSSSASASSASSGSSSTSAPTTPPPTSSSSKPRFMKKNKY